MARSASRRAVVANHPGSARASRRSSRCSTSRSHTVWFTSAASAGDRRTRLMTARTRGRNRSDEVVPGLGVPRPSGVNELGSRSVVHDRPPRGPLRTFGAHLLRLLETIWSADGTPRYFEPATSRQVHVHSAALATAPTTRLPAARITGGAPAVCPGTARSLEHPTERKRPCPAHCRSPTPATALLTVILTAASACGTKTTVDDVVPSAPGAGASAAARGQVARVHIDADARRAAQGQVPSPSPAPPGKRLPDARP